MSCLPNRTGARRAPLSLRWHVRHGAALLLAIVALLFAVNGAQAQEGALAQTDITGPTGSGAFGEKVYTLPNGNFVVVDSLFDTGAIVDVGAVWLYDGATLAPIGSLKGSTAQDKVGSGGVVVLTNGNFVVSSPLWDNGPVAEAGAVTWVNGVSGISGAVSALNSLVGSTADDKVGANGITALSNGNYVVRTDLWDGAAADVGAVTWGNGEAGIKGVVSLSNSLVGSTANDQVGNSGVTALTNGNYVVNSRNWAAADVGAVTWGNGVTGITGIVSASNSLVGSTANDLVGVFGVTALTNGNYVVDSPVWDGAAVDVGAVTWGNGETGIKGTVSPLNSLVGSLVGDQVGFGDVTALSNGNYVVSSPIWDGAAVDVGAVTWGNGLGGTVGIVIASKSLVGSTVDDAVGSEDVTALRNGNYVVSSPFWDGTAVNVGAATWGNGATGTVGVVSPSNSLVGSTANDAVGRPGVTALANGNYVVSTIFWKSAGAIAGAATWGNGTTGVKGVVSASNSLVGTAFDRVGDGGVTALANGNYVVSSYTWDGAATDVGAVTWGNGATGIKGVVSPLNSLVGSTANDQVGYSGVTALTNGNYVVSSYTWDGAAAYVGAATWGDGASGTVGVVSPSNSLVGSLVGDQVGYGVTALTNGNYVVRNPNWDGTAVNSGAISLGNGRIGLAGPVTATNSVLGAAASGGATMVYAFDAVHQAIVVGRPADNIVSVAALRWTLTVTRAGNGAGTVTSSPQGVDCGATCAPLLNGNKVYTLTATPATGSSFTGWGGDCTGSGVCTITSDRTNAVTATFTLNTFEVGAPPPSTGGTVTVDVVTAAEAVDTKLFPVDVAPASAASVNTLYAYGTVLKFTAVPAAGYHFTLWGFGSLSSSQNPIEVTVTGPLSVTASFVQDKTYLYLPTIAK